jgi:hypothetical protein
VHDDWLRWLNRERQRRTERFQERLAPQSEVRLLDNKNAESKLACSSDYVAGDLVWDGKYDLHYKCSYIGVLSASGSEPRGRGWR